MTAETVDAEEIAVLVVCEGCGEQNWRTGPRFAMLCDLIDSNFDCESCGRQLETDAGVIRDA